MLLSEDEKEWIGKWLKKADADLRRARQMAASPADYEAAGFFCQQAVEKYLKARLLSIGIAPARTHDLERLQNELTPAETFSPDEKDQARLLTPYAVIFRYPQDDEEDDIPVADLLAIAAHFQQRLVSAINPLLQ
jgi:HEPN domain-containing protein